MLSGRQEELLKLIVGEYVATAIPVGSQIIVRKYRLGVSSATIRNDMADLEESGFITHPHTSAGRIPSDLGYRHVVDTIVAPNSLPDDVQRSIRGKFRAIDMEVEEWARLAASVLAQMLHNAAIVTVPKAVDRRLRSIELVQLHATLAMLVLVLREARVRQQLLPLAEPIEADTLRSMSVRLNGLIAGADPQTIERVLHDAELSPVEQQVVATVLRMVQALPAPAADDVNLAGLPDALGQPEFSDGRRGQQLAEMLNRPAAVAAMFEGLLGDDAQVTVIGSEHPEEQLRDYSLVLSRYGVPGDLSGMVGLVGPTRLEYDRAIAVVQYLSAVLTELVREVHG